MKTTAETRINEIVGRNVKAEIKRAGKKSGDMPRLLGMSKSKFARRLAGSKEFSPYDFTRLAQILGVDKAIFLAGTTLIEGAEGYSKSDKQFTDIT